MSESIELSLGGDNSKFIAVLKDSEKQAQDIGRRIKGSLDAATSGAGKNSKLVSGVDQLIGDLGRLRTAGDAANLVLGKLGAFARIAGIAAVASELADGFADATKRVTELREEMQKLSRPSGGYNNLALVTTDAITQRITQLEDFMQKNAPKGYMDTVSSFWGGIGSSASDAIMGRRAFSFDDALSGQADRANAGESLLKKERERLAEKYREAVRRTEIRASGDTETADSLDLNARFDEQLGGTGGDRKMVDLVNRARRAEQDVLRARQSAEERSRTTNERFAALGAQDAGDAVGMTTEQEQRLANRRKVDRAMADYKNAQLASEDQPGNKKLSSDLFVAEQNVARVRGESAKWERDIARSKADAIKILDAENKALDLTIQGREKEAQLVKDKANYELQAAQAARAGNDELTDQITNLGKARVKAEEYAAAMDAAGNPKSAGEVATEAIGQRKKENAIDYTRRKLDKNSGVYPLARDSSGRVTEGIDPITKKRVTIDPETGEKTPVEESPQDGRARAWKHDRATKGMGPSFRYGRRGSAEKTKTYENGVPVTSMKDWKDQFKTNSQKEAEAAHAAAVAKAEQTQKEQSASSAEDEWKRDIGTVKTILSDWNKSNGS